MWLTQQQLWALRRQIVLGSLYLSDYVNTFGIDRHAVCDFFDSFLSFIGEKMADDIPGYDDRHFFKHLRTYDTPDELWDWYGCYEENPLPIPEPEVEVDAA